MKGHMLRVRAAGALALGFALAAGDASAVETSLKLYGQVNRALVLADDGDDAYLRHVDNKQSPTRFGIDAKATAAGGLCAGARVEVEFVSNGSTDVNQLTEQSDPTLKERILDVFLEGAYGRVSLGQGDMASNGTSEVDLSGASAAAYSLVGALSGGTIFFDEARRSLEERAAVPASVDPVTGAAVPGVPAKYNPAVKDVYDNLDGASRIDRVRYDTPRFAGFQLSASHGSRDVWDAALWYAGAFGGWRVAAGAGYASLGDATRVALPGGGTADPVTQLNGSFSVLSPFGVGLTGAAGRRWLDDPARDEDPVYWYAKLTYGAALLPAGRTVVGADYSGNGALRQDGDEATSWSAFLVQHLEGYRTEIYAVYRAYALERPGADFADVNALVGGVRVKF